MKKERLSDLKSIVEKTEEFVKERLEGESSGHDWSHILRVRKIARRIAKEEGADIFVVELAALLHDIADWKFQEDSSTETGANIANNWLTELGVNASIVDRVQKIIKTSSFKGAGVPDQMETLEGKIVQDADRLDAMGAIGIGRTFAYGGSKGRQMYNPEIDAHLANNFEEYQQGGQTTINHFHEKLLLLKDRMNTKTAKKLAEHRHQFMEEFLKEFMDEWLGKK